MLEISEKVTYLNSFRRKQGTLFIGFAGKQTNDKGSNARNFFQKTHI